MDIRQHFAPAVRRVPGIVAGTVESGRLDIVGLGTFENEPAPESLCWEIGSITKVFTGVLLADLSIQGVVGLDDPIGRYLPDTTARRLPSEERQPTLSDLATHTAGFARLPLTIYRKARGSSNPYSGLTEGDVFACLGPKSNRPARRRSRYSNYGMGLLGHLLARAGNQPYGTLIQERVLTPLQMTSTGIGSCGEGTQPVAGYKRGRETPPWTFGALAGAGALRSTVTDLATFAGASMDPPDSAVGRALDLARQPVHRGRVSSIGLGWMIRNRNRAKQTTESIWHNGGTYGASSFLAVDPDRSIAVVAFGNTGPRAFPPLDGPSWALVDDLMAASS